MARATNPHHDGKTHASQCEAGFTLLEIMVAMVVLALIVTTAFGAVRMGERSWEAGHARSTETETMRSVANVLQRQFNQILPLSWTVDTETTIAFDGVGDRVRFIAPAPQHRGSTGLFEYTLAVETDTATDNARLVLYYRLHDPDSDGFAPAESDRQRVLLVDQLKTASLAYYGSPVSDDEPEWHTQWNDDAEAFPLMVHARLVTDHKQRQWPELFLALRTGLAK